MQQQSFLNLGWFLDYDNDIDHCNAYDNEYITKDHGCHHTKFNDGTTVPHLEQEFGPKVKKCCPFHGYQFVDNCEVCLY